MREIRLALLSDIPSILEIERDRFPSSFYSQRIYESALRSDSEMVLICEEEGAIIGFLYLSYSLEEAEINHVAVKKAFEGKGIASSLMRKAEKMLYEKEVKTMLLEVRKSNLRAINLYECLGYKYYRTRKNYYQDNSEDAWCYMKGIVNERRNHSRFGIKL